jgi:hypothetical protein
VERNPEDLLIVDCLLPGQVRKLGANSSFMSARRPARTTQADCEIRGGEYVSYDRADYQTALKVWLGQAEMGDADAQNYVGGNLSEGSRNGARLCEGRAMVRESRGPGFAPRAHQSGLHV